MDSSSPENCPSNINSRLGFSSHPNPNFLHLQQHHLSFFPPPQGTNFPPQQEAVCTAPTTTVTTGGAASEHVSATFGLAAPKQMEEFLGPAASVFYGSETKRAAEGVSGFMHAVEDMDPKQHPLMVLSAAETPPPTTKKSSDTFGHRTSIYRGVTRHRWTGRYEAHLWDNTCIREGQTRKGRQVYLGGYDKEEKAARAYDLAALKYWGPATTTNFPVSDYEKEVEEMKPMSRQEFVASLRRKSSGFSRGASIYRGVTRHHQHGRWQARIGRVAGNKDLYLGTFSTQEEAAEAYDIAAVKFRGTCAVTNFDISRYKGTCNIQSITTSSPKPTPLSSLSIDRKNTGTVPFSVSGLPAGYGWPMEVIPVKNEHHQTSTHTTTCGDPVYSMDVPTGDQGCGCGSAEQQMNTASKGGSAFAPAAGGSSSCAGTEVHSFQAPKSNLSALHALILEMEYEAN